MYYLMLSMEENASLPPSFCQYLKQDGHRILHEAGGSAVISCRSMEAASGIISALSRIETGVSNIAISGSKPSPASLARLSR